MADSHVINQAAIDAANTTYITKVGEMFQNSAPSPLADIFAETVPPDSGKTVTLTADDFVSTWRQITGDSADAGGRMTGVSRAYSYSLTLQTFAPDMLAIPRIDFTYDKVGIVARRIQNYLTQNVTWKESLIHTSLFQSSGTGPLGIDGVRLLSTAHPNGPSGNQSNLGTTALSFASFNTGYTAMTSFQREGGENFHVRPKYLVAGPKLRTIAQEITQSDLRGASYANDGLEAGTRIGSAGISNANRGIVEFVLDDRLTGTQDDYWYIVGEVNGLKPMAFVEGMAPVEQINTDMNSDSVMRTGNFLYGLLGDAMVGGYAWPAIYGGIL